ncbi:hypothetical protein KRR55_06150 [Paeniglutamicibacter sp. ABSL32-1]|uniref:hypothetical protein n=1 Tax=Paeniglutamicibacter quisquiliarum TaxID=2849498 RepID=UPI001C2D31A8|nr:hypothetical protein [Paeniglutamicibacter quisquiliarum]MBV1778694.1 hypothetical protein [Paeniglutamicibacter quisquiliarum]
MAEVEGLQSGGDDSSEPSKSTGEQESTQRQATVDTQAIHDKVKRIHELVPSIGTRWRWYDIPYRALWWLITSWPRRLIPWQIRRSFNRALNFFIPFNHFERLKVAPLDDPMDNLLIPEGESVKQGGIWIVEFFPPSYYPQLLNALKKNGWDKERNFLRQDGKNAELVTSARRGGGFSWSRIGTVARPDRGFMPYDAIREMLPEEFEEVELTATQLGQGLTVVTAFVSLSEIGQSSLNDVWTAQHEPTFEWRGFRRAGVQDRRSSAIRATQAERIRLHGVARKWLGRRCGGFFSGTQAGQPIIDFSVFASYDPASDPITPDYRDPIEALAMGGDHLYDYVSPHIPGAVLVPASYTGSIEKRLENCWGVIGAYDRLSNENEHSGYGEKPYAVTTLAAMLDDAIRSFLVRHAILQYTRQVATGYSVARDMARVNHRKFGTRQIEALRRQLLTTSLDLPVMARDSAEVWNKPWVSSDSIQVDAVGRKGDPRPLEGFDLIARFGENREEQFRQLIEQDSDYRDVLSTVASLGASAEDTRLGRRALLVAGVSLVVSLVTLLVTGPGDDSLWSQLLEYVQR